MYALALMHASGVFVLHGPGVSLPVRGAERGQPKAGPASTTETLEVFLEGTTPDMYASVDSLTRLLAKADEFRAGRAPDPPRLSLAQEADGEAFQSPVLSWKARVVFPRRGCLKLLLELERESFWEGAEIDLVPASAPASVWNHADAGHHNWIDIPGEALRGDLPGALHLEISSPAGGEALGDLWVSCRVDAASWDAPRVLEGEDGGGARTASEQASGGAFARCALNAPDNQAVLAWTVDNDAARWFPGPLKPLARFANPPDCAGLQLGWRVTLSSGLSYETRKVELSAELVQELPCVDFAPGIAWGSPPPAALELLASGTGNYTLDVDFVQFCPADATRLYQSSAALPAGWTLIDDYGRVESYDAAQRPQVTHARLGGPLRLAPGLGQRLIFLHGGPALANLSVTARFRPRWRER